MLHTVASLPGPGHSRRLSPMSDGWRHRELLGHCPHKPGKLTGGRHDGHLRRLVAMQQAPEFPPHPVLRLSGDLDHGRRASLAPLAELPTDERTMSIAPRRLHQHTAQMGIAHFGDAAPPHRLARAVLRADQAGKTHTGGRAFKAPELLRLHRQRQHTQGVDALQAPEILDRDVGGRVLRQVFDLLVQGLQPGSASSRVRT